MIYDCTSKILKYILTAVFSYTFFIREMDFAYAPTVATNSAVKSDLQLFNECRKAAHDEAEIKFHRHIDWVEIK